MADIRIKCPSCGATLAVPDDTIKQFIRCGRCRHKFAKPAEVKPQVEEMIASWLTNGEDPESAEAREALMSGAALVGEESLLLNPEDTHVPIPSAAGQAAQQADIRVVRLEQRGVLFEFPTSRLLDVAFRTAIPRQCMSCDSRSHLRAHAVIFAPQLQDSVSVEAEHQAGALILPDEEVRGLSGQDLLLRLREVPNVPYPGNLPMPYWVCDMCGGSGAVLGQIQVNPATGKGWCRLFIRNLRRALDFMVNAGGQDTEGFQALKDHIQQTAENPWEMLPQVVQHRLQQWYHPASDEQFIAYVPDRDRVRAEDGMAGVVVSNVRLIFHTTRHHRECTVDEPLELIHASGGGKGSIALRTANWEIRHMNIDRDGISRLRRGLTVGKFKAVWL